MAATAWLALGRPYPAAYAQWRQAEALLATKAPRAKAEEALRAAHAVAVRLSAAPLRRELELLAQRGRIRLEPPGEPALAEPKAPSVAASVGLTRREAEVVALVAAGRTNRQLGQALFIAPRRPASTSHGSLPSREPPAAGKRPRSPTASASQAMTPSRPWLLFLRDP